MKQSPTENNRTLHLNVITSLILNIILTLFSARHLTNLDINSRLVTNTLIARHDKSFTKELNHGNQFYQTWRDRYNERVCVGFSRTVKKLKHF